MGCRFLIASETFDRNARVRRAVWERISNKDEETFYISCIQGRINSYFIAC
jgi:hypothetical protein